MIDGDIFTQFLKRENLETRYEKRIAIISSFVLVYIKNVDKQKPPGFSIRFISQR